MEGPKIGSSTQNVAYSEIALRGHKVSSDFESMPGSCKNHLWRKNHSTHISGMSMWSYTSDSVQYSFSPNKRRKGK